MFIGNGSNFISHSMLVLCWWITISYTSSNFLAFLRASVVKKADHGEQNQYVLLPSLLFEMATHIPMVWNCHSTKVLGALAHNF